MKNIAAVISMLFMLVCVGINCHPDNPDPADSILYQDIDPDTTLAYDLEVLNPDPYKVQGNFSYLIDLDRDGTDDFEISGSTWPGHFDHVVVEWSNDHETKVAALHQNAYIALKNDYEMCCATELETGEVIDDQFAWAAQARLSYEIIDSFVQCSWNSDYLAVKLIKDGHAVFGWLDIDGYEIPTIKDMAVNLTLDKKILAGQKQ